MAPLIRKRRRRSRLSLRATTAPFSYLKNADAMPYVRTKHRRPPHGGNAEWVRSSELGVHYGPGSPWQLYSGGRWEENRNAIVQRKLKQAWRFRHFGDFRIK